MQIVELGLQAVFQIRQTLPVNQILDQRLVRHLLRVNQVFNQLVLIQQRRNIAERALDILGRTRFGSINHYIVVERLIHPDILGKLASRRPIIHD